MLVLGHRSLVPPSSSGLGYQVLILETGVRLPLGVWVAAPCTRTEPQPLFLRGPALAHCRGPRGTEPALALAQAGRNWVCFTDWLPRPLPGFVSHHRPPARRNWVCFFTPPALFLPLPPGPPVVRLSDWFWSSAGLVREAPGAHFVASLWPLLFLLALSPKLSGRPCTLLTGGRPSRI
jgi:hypothetical protein